MSEAVVAFGDTATPDWVLFEATSEREGVGATGAATACCCCGWTVDWLESAAIRAEAALPALSREAVYPAAVMSYSLTEIIA